MQAMEEIEKQIEAVLEKIRPFLRREGGDVEYVGFQDGVVYIRMIGACDGCIYVDQDISAGIEIILMEEVPGVIRCDGSMKLPPEVEKAYQERKKEEVSH